MNEDFALFQSFLNNEGTEKGVFAKFYDKYVKTGKILENGLPEFRVETWVEIRIVNDYDTADRKAEREDFRRFPKEYEFYKIRKEKAQDGTPLKMFAFVTPDQIEGCEMRGIFTVEDLASLNDEQAQSLGLSIERDLAVKFLETAKNNQKLAEYEEEIRRLKARIEQLEEKE